MAHFEIIVGSVLGATEYVADAVLETLEKCGMQGTIHLTPTLGEIDASRPWIICTSTHGAGDLPDNIQPFADALANASLNTTRFLVIGLGDSSYDTYCFGAMKMQSLCEAQGATLLAPPLHIDVLNHPIPEEIAAPWLEKQISAQYLEA
ncbi:flavodoxin domain-containing protein [Aestuariibacter sp. AA17]|uniref:Flavodoxin domain-containing protein n=1 Tax=Fluctibacter corallii TaxID=2984329 RepID=A0ABT3ACX9_9ALTE|nr:flavodoxin domain-containing protein [Aestuariibacter sp. AA17]MCV2886529.1 flavodoxin domain-containing protein [Aestuariibacter sp. AA17]